MAVVLASWACGGAARTVLFRWNCGGVALWPTAGFKLNRTGVVRRSGVARWVVLPVTLVGLGALDQQEYFVGVAFGGLVVGVCDPGGDLGCRVPGMAVVGASARGWVLVGSVVTLLASPGPAGLGPVLVWFTDLGLVIILDAVVRPVRRPSGLSLRAVRGRGRPS